jgi:hypothetical protein
LLCQKSSTRCSSRAFDLKLQKKTKKAEYWPRLTKTKNHFVKTNFDKWVDEDEQEGVAVDDDPDFESMGGGGGSDFGDLQRVSGPSPSIQYITS